MQDTFKAPSSSIIRGIFSRLFNFTRGMTGGHDHPSASGKIHMAVDDNATVQSILSMASTFTVKRKPKDSTKYDLNDDIFASVKLSDEKLEKILEPLMKPSIYYKCYDMVTGRVDSHQLYFLQGDFLCDIFMMLMGNGSCGGSKPY